MKIIVVDRSKFTLVLYRPKDGAYDRERSYKIAVGMADYGTPPGVRVLLAKVKNPDWKMPDSDWVPEEKRGQVVKGGDPDNPLVAAFLDLGDGYGIHGTANDSSIGTAASHGCLRMHPDDVMDLYKRVGKGTPVVIT